MGPEFRWSATCQMSKYLKVIDQGHTCLKISILSSYLDKYPFPRPRIVKFREVLRVLHESGVTQGEPSPGSWPLATIPSVLLLPALPSPCPVWTPAVLQSLPPRKQPPGTPAAVHTRGVICPRQCRQRGNGGWGPQLPWVQSDASYLICFLLSLPLNSSRAPRALYLLTLEPGVLLWPCMGWGTGTSQ